MTLYRMVRESDNLKVNEAHLTSFGNGRYGLSMHLKNGRDVFAMLPKWIEAKPENEKWMVLYCQFEDLRQRAKELFDRCFYCHCDR